MSLWDQHAEFLAEEAASLVCSTDASEAKALLSRMRKCYAEALNQLVFKYDCVIGELEIEGDTEITLYRSLEDPLPASGLYSKSLRAYEEIFFLSPTTVQADTAEIAEAKKFFDVFRENTGDHPVTSSHFEIQQFSREEIDRWLRVQGIESEYAFLPEQAAQENTEGTANSPCTVWVTQEKLLAAFEDWGLKAAWFRALQGHQWLLNARRQEGVGGRGGRKALFCPYAVMVGLTKDIKARSKDEKLPFNEGVRILRSRFPKAADEHIPDYMQD